MGQLRWTRFVATTVGAVQLNIGSDYHPANFLNMLQPGSIGFFGGASPGTMKLDSNGYPTGTLSGPGGMALTFSDTNWAAGGPGIPLTFIWTAGTKLQVIALGSFTGGSVSGAGGSINGSSGFNFTVTIDGSGAGSATFTPSTLALQFPGTAAYGAAGASNLQLRRASDVGRTGYLIPEYVARISGIKSGRTAGWDQVANDNNQSMWAYRARSTSLAWTNQFPPGAWSGGVGSAGTATGSGAFTAAAAPDTSLSGWVDGEVLQCILTDSDTAPVTVSGATNNGSGLWRLTVTSAVGLPSNRQVYISGAQVSGGGALPGLADGYYLITNINGTTIDVQGSTYNGVTYLANSATVTPYAIQVSGAANNGSGLWRLTVTSAGQLVTNQQVWLTGVLDVNTKEILAGLPDGIYTITKINNTTIDLQGSTYNATGTYYTGSGNIGTQTLAITGKTGGAKFICGLIGSPVGIPGAHPINTGLATFTYNAVLDQVIYGGSTITSAIPVDVSAAICNQLGCNLWLGVPFLATDDFVTNLATAALTLNSSLYFMPEYSNEIWNFGFSQTHLANYLGARFGFLQGNRRCHHGWYGLRVRQMWGNLIPPVWSGRTAQLRRIMAYQAAGSITDVGPYRLEGQDLVPGNARYNAYTGSANYSTLGQRPIDFCEVISHAPYCGGANLFNGPDVKLFSVADSYNASFYQTLVNAMDTGATATAIAMVDNDLRQGRNMVQNVTWDGVNNRFVTPAAHGFTFFNNVDTDARLSFQATGGSGFSGLAQGAVYHVTSVPTPTTFTINGFVNGSPGGANINPGTASGTVTVGWIGSPTLNNVTTMQMLCSTYHQYARYLATTYSKRLEWYEGGIEPMAASNAQLVALGITSTNGGGPGASAGAAITAWRNDPMAATTTQLYFQQFMGTDPNMIPTYGLMPNARTPAWLVYTGPPGTNFPAGNAWGLINGSMPNSATFQTYNGVMGFVSGVN